MEVLLNTYGWAAAGPLIVLIALPMMVGGLFLRRRGRRRGESVAMAHETRRKLGDVTAGAVTVEGRWRALDGARGLVEDESAPERRVLVERPAGAPAIADGATVCVVGCATRQVEDPRGAGYRGGGRIWVIEATSRDGNFVSADPSALTRAASRARLLAGLGAGLFAAGLIVAVASSMVVWRASGEEPPSFGAND